MKPLSHHLVPSVARNLNLRSTLSQARLDHLILHYHQDVCDILDMKSIATRYIAKMKLVEHMCYLTALNDSHFW